MDGSEDRFRKIARAGLESRDPFLPIPLGRRTVEVLIGHPFPFPGGWLSRFSVSRWALVIPAEPREYQDNRRVVEILSEAGSWLDH